MTARASAFSFSLLLIASGCGGEDPFGPAVPPPRELQQPLLRSVAPTNIRAGEQLTILGADFADTELGEVRLTFEGVFQTSAGKSTPVNLEVIPEYQNQGMLTWEFGPNIPFTTDEDTGNFRGVLKATNVGRDGQIKETAQALGVEMQVLPSILIRQLRPVTQGCAAGVRETTDNTKILLEVKAIGLKSGSTIAPLRFVYSFMKDSFQFAGYLSNTLSMDPEALFPKTGPVSVVDEVRSGTISSIGSGAPRNIYVYQGGYTPGMATLPRAVENLFSMTSLITSPLPDAQNSRKANMNIVAVDSAGREAERTIQFTVWSPVEVRYDGAHAIKKSYDPVPVSGCIAGGDIGRDVTYSEATAETRSRTFSVNSKVSGGFDIKVARLNAEFGIDVQAQVSSSSAKSLSITGKVLPREFAVFYRQTLQLERSATLIGHGACGGSQDLGDVVVTDWTWSPDLAKGMGCPPLPPSNLPMGQDFE